MAVNLNDLNLLKRIVLEKLRHQDYARVTELSKLYRALISGEGLDVYLKKFVRRESDEMFKQRVDITQHITPAIAENCLQPIYKVARTNRVFQSITHTGPKAVAEIRTAMQRFYGEGEQSGLDYYMQTRYIDLTADDPNAFVAVEFDAFDPKVQKAQPKPVEISSEEAIWFEYKNAILQRLVAMWPHTYKNSKGEAKAGERYVMYLRDEAVELREVDPKDALTDLPEGSYEFFEVGEKGKATYRLFTKQEFEPKSGTVPAARVGYKRDPFTKGRTYVSPIHPALPFFRKSLKAVSEMDLTVSLHVHPQKLQYVTPCPGQHGKGCIAGKTRDGVECSKCKGSGADPVSTTAQDVLRLPLPKDPTQMVDLEKVVVYKTPPVELIKWMDEYVDKISEKAVRAIYTSNQFTKPTVAKTATEVDDTADAINDTLAPFAKKYSSTWMQFVRLIATYTENADGLTIYHRFPSDFKLKGQSMLLNELSLANTSGAPAYVLDSINADIMEILYADDPDTLAKLRIKQKYLPFKGKSPEQISIILSSSLTSNYHKILYANFEEVWDALEEEHGDKIWLMESSKQREAVRKQVDAIATDVQKAQAKQLADFAKAGGGMPPKEQQ